MWAALSRHRSLLAVGVLLTLPFVLLYAQTRSPGARGPVVGVILDVAGGIERGLLWATGGMSDFLEVYVTGVDNAEELSRLRRHARSNQALQANVRELEQENESLRALAGVASQIDGPRPIGARVIGRSGAPLAGIARIDRGRRDGVRRGDGVTTTGGIVGRILDAGFTTSDILLATDPASAIDVVVQRTRARGIVRGKGEAEAYTAEVQDFDRLADIRDGDTLVTSGLDPSLPAGLFVGSLHQISRHEDGLYQRAAVKPGADLATVEHVLVMISRRPDRRPQLGRETPAAPAADVDGGPTPATSTGKRETTSTTKAKASSTRPPNLVPKRPAPVAGAKPLTSATTAKPKPPAPSAPTPAAIPLPAVAKRTAAPAKKAPASTGAAKTPASSDAKKTGAALLKPTSKATVDTTVKP